jgi:hypothetical protein
MANDLKGDSSFEEIRLTVLAHISLYFKSEYEKYYPNVTMRDIMKIENIGTDENPKYQIVDDRGVVGTDPADKYGAFYAELRLYMGNLLGLYEMGLQGVECYNALMHAADNLGVIQRWVLQYKSPFNMADGTKREVDFIFKNNLVGKDGSKLTTFDGKPTTLKDFNHANIKTPEKGVIREKRTYIAPNDSLKVIPYNPRNPRDLFYFEDNDEGEMTPYIRYVARLKHPVELPNGDVTSPTWPIDEGVLHIYGTTDMINDAANSTGLFGTKLPLELKVNRNSSSTLRWIEKSTINDTEHNSKNGWYEINFKLTTAEYNIIKNSGFNYFHLHEMAQTDVGAETRFGEAFSPNHPLDQDPPKLEQIIVENPNLRVVWGDLQDNTGNKVYGGATGSPVVAPTYKIVADNLSGPQKYSTIAYQVGYNNTIFEYPSEFKVKDKYVAKDFTKEVTYNMGLDGGYSTYINEAIGSKDELIITLVYIDHNPAQKTGDTFTWNVKVDNKNYNVRFTVISETKSDGGTRLVAQGTYALPNGLTHGAEIVVEPDLKDTIGNNMSEAIKSIFISKVSNQMPKSDEVSKLDFTANSLKNNKYANDDYSIGLGNPDGTGNIIGLRAYDIRFKYNYKESDRLEEEPKGVGSTSVGTSSSNDGEHKKSKTTGTTVTDINQQYGFQIDRGYSTADIVIDKTGHYDDGSYVYTLHMYDKAGNPGPKNDSEGKKLIDSATDDENKMYVDTIAPRFLPDENTDNGTAADYATGNEGYIHKTKASMIDYGIVIKTANWNGVKDASGNIITADINNDYLKYGDKFYLESKIKDYNLDTTNVIPNIPVANIKIPMSNNATTGIAEISTANGNKNEIKTATIVIKDNSSNDFTVTINTPSKALYDNVINAVDLATNTYTGAIDEAERTVTAEIDNIPPDAPILAAVAQDSAIGGVGGRNTSKMDNGNRNELTLNLGASEPGKFDINGYKGHYTRINDYYIVSRLSKPYADIEKIITNMYIVDTDGTTIVSKTKSGATGEVAKPESIGANVSFATNTDNERAITISALGVTVVENQLDGIEVDVVDKYGWPSGKFSGTTFTKATPNTTYILVDTAINTSPIGDNVSRRLPGAGGVAAYKKTENNILYYDFKVVIKDSLINEFAGVWRYQLTGMQSLANASNNLSVTGKNGVYTFTTTGEPNIVLTPVDNEFTIVDFPIPPEKSAVIGGTVRMKFNLTDNLGNVGSYYADFAIPDRSTGVKARDAGSEREVETKTKVGDEVKIGERKEGGKND